MSRKSRKNKRRRNRWTWRFLGFDFSSNFMKNFYLTKTLMDNGCGPHVIPGLGRTSGICPSKLSNLKSMRMLTRKRKFSILAKSSISIIGSVFPLRSNKSLRSEHMWVPPVALIHVNRGRGQNACIRRYVILAHFNRIRWGLGWRNWENIAEPPNLIHGWWRAKRFAKNVLGKSCKNSHQID